MTRIAASLASALGILLFWLLALPFWDGEVAPAGTQAIVLAGSLALLLAARPRPADPMPAAARWAAAPLLLLALLVPWPWSAAGPFLGAGALLGQRPGRRARTLATSLTLLGASLACASLVAALLFRFAGLVHALPLLSRGYGRWLAAVGLGGAPWGESWTVLDTDLVPELVVTVEGLGLHALALLAAAAAPVLAWQGGIRWRALLLAALLAALHLLVRQAAVLALVLSSRDPRWLWSAWFVALGFVPLVLLWTPLLAAPSARAGRVPSALWPARGGVRLTALGGALALALWGLLVELDPGVRKRGAVLIDEHHSNWEWTDTPLDTQDYSSRSTYNYTGLLRFLDCYYDVEVNRAPLDDERLAAIDVLVVKTPTESYEEHEVEAILEFVERGGGLFLVGDHTNVFGTSHYLNRIATRFGLRFEYDATYGLHGGLSLYHAPTIAAHPAVEGLPPFLFATSCTLSASSPAVQPVQTGTGLKALALDYSLPGFFADTTQELFFGFGLFHQALAASHGRGRVLAFSDSTVWSSFFMFVPGKPELLLGMVEWLNRTPRFPWLRGALGIVALGAAAGLVLLAARRHRGQMLAVLVAGAVVPGLWSAVLVASALEPATAHAHAPREPLREWPEVWFCSRGSDFFLPVERLVDTHTPSYLTFFNWVQRLGPFPRLSADLGRCVEEGEAVVLLRRHEPLSEAELELLDAYLARGGRVLVLADPHTRAATAPLLARAGLRWRTAPALWGADPEVAGPPPPPACRVGGAPLALSAARWDRLELAVSGGEPWLVRSDGAVLAATAAVGEGLLVVAGCAEVFSNEAMESVPGSPTPEELELYEVEYGLLRTLLPGSTGATAATAASGSTAATGG